MGKVIGPALVAADVPPVIERIVENYRMRRRPKERFIDTLKRIGVESYRAAAYKDDTTQEYAKEASNG